MPHESYFFFFFKGPTPGKCPILKYYQPCVSDNDHCVVDGDCFGVKKCCFNTCFKVCADPVPESGAIAGASKFIHSFY